MPKEDKREESSSFLKKRTKKLLSYVEPTGAQEEMWVLRRQAPPNAAGLYGIKSFLFLFFKKEILPCFARMSVVTHFGIRRGDVHWPGRRAIRG